MLFDTIQAELATKTDLKMLEQKMENEFTRFEYRIVTKLGIIVVTSVTLAVAIGGWLIKL